MLSTGLIAIPTTIQQASAQPLFGNTENEIENDVDSKIDQENKCNGPSTCTNTGTATSDGDDDFQIKQMNKCNTNIKHDDSTMLDMEGTSRSSVTAPNDHKASSATVIDLGTGTCNTNADISDTEDD